MDSPRQAPSGERRHLTVLFADMVGFTAISERLGEEGTFALIQPIYELMAQAVTEQGGSVKDFTGDGIMALFGVPEALEDGPLRACRAALLIQERLSARAPEIERDQGVRPQMRIGINTGLAVVTKIGGDHSATTALGDTVNLASRIESLAETGAVLLSEATYRLVAGLVEASFAGEHNIKGKSEPQKVYRLDYIREGATRFDAALSRGLTAYVGRQRELQVLARELAVAGNGLRVVDVVAEPGMGKSRLLHEFRQHIDSRTAFILHGGCSIDGQNTSLLPFIEIMRGSFQLRIGEHEPDIAKKLAAGLTKLELDSLQNRALLLNLLGLKVPDGSLAGLDGVKIGLRTRELLQDLLKARCRISPVAMLIEDIHWIDGASEELLGRFIRGGGALPLLIIHTRRPEYTPPWLDAAKSLPLVPLPPPDIRILMQSRLGIGFLPEQLVRSVSDRADGNPLFAEEIVSFLAERGIIRGSGSEFLFDDKGVAKALPASVQSLLTARVDRLAPPDRSLLQAAAVIGLSFNAELLAAVADMRDDISASLAAMCALDLLRAEGKAGDYAFKHALIRDALYQSLLTGARRALHLKVAQEIERRSDNRLTEVAETLARHYGETDRADKAFTYLAMAGAKSFGVYSLDEARNHFAAALTLLDAHPDCAADRAIAEFLVDYTQLLNLNLMPKTTADTVERYRATLDRLGDSEAFIVIGARYVVALIEMGRYQEAAAAQEAISRMAARLPGVRGRAYAFICELQIAPLMAGKSLEEYDAYAREALTVTDPSNEAAIHFAMRWFLAQEEFTRGRMSEARRFAEEMIDAGRRLNDPVTIGLALGLFGWLAIFMDRFEAAIEFGSDSINMATTPFDRLLGMGVVATAKVLLRRRGAKAELKSFRDMCAAADIRHWLMSTDVAWGVAMVLEGEIGRGLRHLEGAILRREAEGQHAFADLTRLTICDLYLAMIVGDEKPPPLPVLLRNMGAIVAFMIRGRRRLVAHIAAVKQNPQFDRDGYHSGHCEAILGFLYAARKQRDDAIPHLTDAKRILAQFGATPLLHRIEGALAQVQNASNPQP